MKHNYTHKSPIQHLANYVPDNEIFPYTPMLRAHIIAEEHGTPETNGDFSRRSPLFLFPDILEFILFVLSSFKNIFGSVNRDYNVENRSSVLYVPTSRGGNYTN